MTHVVTSLHANGRTTYLANFDRWTFEEDEAREFVTCVKAHQHAAQYRYKDGALKYVRVVRFKPLITAPLYDPDAAHFAAAYERAKDLYRK